MGVRTGHHGGGEQRRSSQTERLKGFTAGHRGNVVEKGKTVQSHFTIICQHPVSGAVNVLDASAEGIHASLEGLRLASIVYDLFMFLTLYTPSLRRGHADILCSVTTSTDGPIRESTSHFWTSKSWDPPGLKRHQGPGVRLTRQHRTPCRRRSLPISRVRA